MERVPCDPEIVDTNRCEVYRKIGRCFMDVHHIYHPRRAYRKEVDREFRNLDENKVYICRDMHNTEHAVFEPPEKPDRELMEMAVEEDRNRRAERKTAKD